MEAAIEAIKKALEAEDYDAMKTTLDTLNEKMQAAATEMYSQAQGAPGAEGEPEAGAGGDAGGEKQAADVEEADFEMVDEDEKK